MFPKMFDTKKLFGNVFDTRNILFKLKEGICTSSGLQYFENTKT